MIINISRCSWQCLKSRLRAIFQSSGIGVGVGVVWVVHNRWVGGSNRRRQLRLLTISAPNHGDMGVEGAILAVDYGAMTQRIG